MIKIFYTDTFLKSARKLDTKQQTKLAKLVFLLSENPFHAQLHTKSLSGEFAGLYSFRVMRDWRVVFRFSSPDSIVLVDVGHRKDIYRS